jgi:dynein regulatory complex protein 1
LEKEMQILEKCMEDMKAVFRLNEEKLDFNKKVLNDREKANSSHKLNLKERERKLVDMVRTEKGDF